MTLMRNPQPLCSTARYPHGLHGRFYRLQGSYMWHDEPRDNDVFEATFRALERLLSGVERKPEIAVAQVLGIGQSRAINVGDYSRLDQYHPHSCHPQGLVVFFDREEANHCPKPYASGRTRNIGCESQNVTSHGEQTVKANSGGMVSGRIDPSADHVSPPVRSRYPGSESANIGGDYVNPQALPTLHKGNASLAAREGEKPLHLITPAGESLAQIADQSPRYGIGQDQSPDNSPLFLVIDPSDDPDIAVYYFNVGTAAKRIRDHQRLTQRFWLFVGHQSLRNSHSSAARFNRSDSPRLPLTPASGAHLKSAPRTAGDITSLAAHEAGKSAALNQGIMSHSNTTPIAFRRQG